MCYEVNTVADKVFTAGPPLQRAPLQPLNRDPFPAPPPPPTVPLLPDETEIRLVREDKSHEVCATQQAANFSHSPCIVAAIFWVQLCLKTLQSCLYGPKGGVIPKHCQAAGVHEVHVWCAQVLTYRRAVREAQRAGLDLIGVALTAQPPVFRLGNADKAAHAARQREKDLRRKEVETRRKHTVKEVGSCPDPPVPSPMHACLLPCGRVEKFESGRVFPC